MASVGSHCVDREPTPGLSSRKKRDGLSVWRPRGIVRRTWQADEWFHFGLTEVASRCEPHVVVCDCDLITPALLDEWATAPIVSEVPLIAVSLTRRPEDLPVLADRPRDRRHQMRRVLMILLSKNLIFSSIIVEREAGLHNMHNDWNRDQAGHLSILSNPRASRVRPWLAMEPAPPESLISSGW